MPSWPSLPEVRRMLRLQPDSNEDLVIQSALDAAIEYGVARMGNDQIVNPDGSITEVPSYPPTATDVPARAYEACLLHAARLYRRRDSIDGALGFSDTGLIRVGRSDPDIDGMYASIGPMVFG